MMQLKRSSKASSERGRLRGLETRRQLAAELGKDTIRNGDVLWHISTIDRMSAAQFEQWLANKFGPEYLEPISYHWVDGQLVPVAEVSP